jgi:acetyltransferase
MEAQVSPASVSIGKWSPSRDASDIVKSIHAMLHPRNIVLVGATDKPGNYAERIWNNLIKYQYAGGLYPVNAKREMIWGVPCYKDFASLPDRPDHVLVLVPARFAVQVIRDAAAAGARSATIVTSGFSELQDDESQRPSCNRLFVRPDLRSPARIVSAISAPAKTCSPISTTASSRWRPDRSRSPVNPARLSWRSARRWKIAASVSATWSPPATRPASKPPT